ncbi:MAG: PD40 domain-containing protein, partial [Lentisphaeria bacterium]|nr:PD40 domain-containing protein [Lentisphaeria bacterium]
MKTIFNRLKGHFFFGLISCLLLSGTAFGQDGKKLAKEILAMTGARTKIVWARAMKGMSGKNWEVLKEEYELMLFDTNTGKEKVVLPGPAMYGCPWITPDGQRIIFTTKIKGKKADMVQVVDINGKNRRDIAEGFGHCVWMDPKTGVQWVYISVGRLMRILPDNTTDWVKDRHSVQAMYKYRIDKPSVRELAWTGDSSIRFRVSADGTRAGSEFGWPKAGVANMVDKKSWKRYGHGCNSMIAPDNSYRFFHMGSPVGHKGILMYDAGGINKRNIWFKNMPGGYKAGDDSWIPKWSSDVRFLTI